MLSAEENELLTRIGPGTPMGELQRRYWHPIASADEMRDRWTKRVRLLCEDLVLYKDRSGKLGLIAEFCPHRRASLAYGIPTEDGIRCPYHGWQFDGTGRCVEQPNEPVGSTFKERISTAGYPVEVLGGLIFAYLGPLPAPLVPRWPGFVGDDVIRTIGWCRVPCNWLQIMENSLDPVHTEWLHGHMNEFIREQRGVSRQFSRHHLKIDFEEFEFGVYKRRLLAGQSEESDDWKVGHPVLFPNILALGSGGGDLWSMHSYHIRIPVDDTTTIQLTYTAYEPPAGVAVPERLLRQAFSFDVPIHDEHGEYPLEILDIQDVMVWVAQGPIARRDVERLGTTDAGVILYRNLLRRELANIAAGKDPLGTIRDPERNDRIRFPLEKNKAHFMDGFAQLLRTTVIGLAPCADDLVALFAQYNRSPQRSGTP
jgi:5,5'-dehydrodivanillate O-demethylase oxygenase subunit